MANFRITAICCAAALSACASAPPQALVPVSASCLSQDSILSLPPTTANAELSHLSDYELVLRIAAERLDLIAYSRQASAIIEGCR